MGSALIALVVAVAAVWAGEDGSPQFVSQSPELPMQLPAFTSPSARATLAGVQDGRVGAIHAREGAFVRAGDVVVQLDDRVQRQRVETVRVRAESEDEINLARVRLDRATAELERVRDLKSRGTATDHELQVAEADVAEQQVCVEIARTRREEARRELKLAETLLSEHAITAPFDGYVSERAKEVGEAVEPRDGIVTVVKLDPLEVMLECPVTAAGRLTPGRSLLVTSAINPRESRAGRVDRISRVAGAASQTVRVRILLPNPKLDWMAGVRVNVEIPFTAPTAIGASFEKSPQFLPQEQP
ncbi:MAG: efflux RND transporter periplasmic adaptor subunit [Planctomycetes bacterium]|nr:efflux RND transporter periplasmic adaptor subunit [Planctomycetota bacterium]